MCIKSQTIAISAKFARANTIAGYEHFCKLQFQCPVCETHFKCVFLTNFIENENFNSIKFFLTSFNIHKIVSRQYLE